MTSHPPPGASLLLLAFFVSGCLATSDYTRPERRLTDLSAYTLPAGELKMGLGLVGTDFDNVGADLPLDVGIPGGLQVGTNVGHDAVALLNLDLKWNAVDTRHFGLGIQAGIKWLNPSNIYALPQDIRSELGKVNLYILPIRIETSYPILPWLDAHLGVGYQHTVIDGTVSEGSALAKGHVGTREITIHPRVGLYPGGKVAIIVGAIVPVWARAVASVQAVAEVQPGVVAGVQDTEFVRIPLNDLYTVYIATEFRWGRTHFRVTLTQGLRFLTQQVPFPLPAFDLYWRF